MTGSGATLLPVEERDGFFVISEEWNPAEIPFPSLAEKSKLLSSGYTTGIGRVHLKGGSRLTTLLLPPDDGDQTFAILEEDENIFGGNEDADFEESTTYLRAIEFKCGHSEWVFPEQRCDLNSEYVEPSLRLLQTKQSNVSWARLRSINAVLLCAGPGAGKTTLMRRWVLWHAREAEASRRVPVYVQLRHWRAGEEIDALIRRSVAETGDEHVTKSLPSLAAEGRLAIALDGVDEVPAEDRADVIAEIDRFALKNPRCKYLVSTRPYSDFKMGIGAVSVTIEPFSASQLREYAFHKLAGVTISDQFCARIEAEDFLGGLTRNPLGLSVLVTRYLRDEMVPSHVTDAVAAIVDMLVDQWDSGRGVVRRRHSPLSLSQRRKALIALAASGAGNDWERKISEVVPEASPDETLRMVQEYTGLIERDQSQPWVFRLSILTQFFASVHWVLALSSRMQEFVDILTGRRRGEKEHMSRFIAALSSDASTAIAAVIKQSRSTDFDLASNLAAALTQPALLSSVVVESYANFITSVLENQLSHCSSVNIKENEGGGLVWHLSARTQDPSELPVLASFADLTSWMHKGRDSTAGRWLRDKLSTKEEPVLRHLALLMASEGSLISESAESSVTLRLFQRPSDQQDSVQSRGTG